MTDAPAPLTPAECDLRAFRDFPFDIGRFQKSDLVLYEEPEAILAALNLWCAAWHEVPAASVPNDDKWLAKQAGYGRAVDSWATVKEGALRGFVLCSDGRLYNRTLAEKANSSWDSRLKYEWSKAGDRHRKRERSLEADQRTAFPDFDDWKQGRVPDLSGGSDVGSDGKPDTFRRKVATNPTENALKGREGKGREGNLKNQSTDLDSDIVERANEIAPAEAGGSGGDDPVPVGSPTDGKDRFDVACAAAGMNLIQPGHIAKAHDQLRQWEEAGIDFDGIVLPTIKAVTADSPDPTYSLKRFDTKVRHEHARAGAKGAAGKPYVPPTSPDLEPDGEDEQFRPLRAALLKAFKAAEFTRYVNPVRFEQVDDRKVVRVVESRKGPMRLMDDGRDDKVRAAAARLGWEDVW